MTIRVVVSGGGTGGHIYPALAVATHLRDRYHAEILYLGSDDGLETQLVPAAGFRIATIKAGKLRRYISWNTVKGVARVPIGLAQAVGIVRSFRPDVVFSSGGYVAVPAGLAARINGVPLLMHQQDVPPNLSNKLIAPLASKISVAFADSVQYFPARKTLHLGNPVRQEILSIRQTTVEEARQALGFQPEIPLLLVTGGSQGARHLNQTVVESLPAILPHWQVLQISGNKLFAETQEAANRVLQNVDENLKQRYRLVAYMSDEMPMALQAAAIVLGRAGAATLSELAVLGKPGILVPLPPAIGSSPQEVNADMFGRENAAIVVRNSALRSETLIEQLTTLSNSTERLLSMSEAVLRFARPHATDDIVEAVVKLAGKTAAPSKKHEGINV